MKKTLLKSLFSVIAVCSFFFEVNAAPTVKKLGTPVAANTATAVKTSAATTNRAASVRFDTQKATTSPQKVSSTETDSTRMLPSSKYMQVVHSVKPGTSNGSGTTPTPSSDEIVVIKDRITNAESDISTLRQDLDNHVNDSSVHVDASEKETWNGKQDALTAGKGIIIENNVVSATMKIPMGAEDAPHTIPIWVE